MKIFVKVNKNTNECISPLKMINNEDNIPIEEGFIFVENTLGKGLIENNINKHDPCKGFYYNIVRDKFIRK